MIGALGIVFQIPAVIFVLSRIGLVTAGWPARHFRHAVLISIVTAAVLTPRTDFGNISAICWCSQGRWLCSTRSESSLRGCSAVIAKPRARGANRPAAEVSL